MEPIWHVTASGTPDRPGDEGFVHASFASQLAGTLELHFPDAGSVVLLRLDPQALGERLVVEASRNGQPFPHVYGEIQPADVVQQRQVQRGLDGRFELEG